MPRKFSAFIQTQVRQRANRLCEYCHTNERWQYVYFTIDHVIPVTENGSNSIDNLALACFFCNRRKSGKQRAVDPESSGETFIFNPRTNNWAEHFIWSADGLQIIPLTDIGRATVELLKFNRERVLLIREADVSVKRHPPEDDPIQKSR